MTEMYTIEGGQNAQFKKWNKKNCKNSRRSQFFLPLFSACRKYKDRVIIGTHATPWKQMKEFASTADNAIYVSNI